MSGGKREERKRKNVFLKKKKENVVPFHLNICVRLNITKTVESSATPTLSLTSMPKCITELRPL